MKVIAVQLCGISIMLLAYYADNKDPIGTLVGTIWLLAGFIMEEIRNVDRKM
jgi:hypothetical protein